MGKITLFVLAVYCIVKCFKGIFRLVTISYWFIWLVTVILTDRFLLFHPNEYIHYPQYAILAILLALCIDSDRSKVPWARILFWTTFMGVLDEMNQYFYLCKNHGDYLDFNDMLMNIQGAQAGLLLLYGFRQSSQKSSGPINLLKIIKSFILSFEGITVLLSAAIVSIFLYTGTLQITAPSQIPPGGIVDSHGSITIFLERLPHIMGSWGQSPSGRSYYILRPLEGLILLSGLGFLYSTFTFWRSK